MPDSDAAAPLLPQSTTPTQHAIDMRRTGACVLAEGQEEVGSSAQQSQVQKRLIWALIICFIFMIVEVVGGYLANSLAIMTDAAHLLSDVSGFAVALFAGVFATRKSGDTHTFGYHRIEVLGALASVLSSWLVTGILVYEAIQRIIEPVAVNGKGMFALAVGGLLVNLINFFILGAHGHAGHSHGGHSHGEHAHSHGENGHSHGHEHGHAHGNSHGSHDHGHSHDDESESINLRGAVLHIIGDLVQSIGVAIAGALIWWKQVRLPSHLLSDASDREVSTACVRVGLVPSGGHVGVV
ncbi:hypothetical protein WJX84_006624 [Apatococcus fuscideae]|uniref:Cation efflux protein transmembrane domain-containing protein n=1 Tax=Apatococcus fuscideae TaxID=2026836 RepID=A0AAW1SYJ2_9CHLO